MSTRAQDSRIQLRPGDVHFWFATTPRNSSAQSLAEGPLSADEHRRANRFLSKPAKELYIFAHTLLRVTLARYLGLMPEAIRFRSTVNGRPELVSSPSGRELRFNLSHTDGLVACVVSHLFCGVDVEAREPQINHSDLAEVVLSEEELAAWRRHPSSDCGERFMRIWTLKEAYVKARGLGLALPLREITFVRFGLRPKCTFGVGIQDDHRRWSFWSGTPTPFHCSAVAVASDRYRAKLSTFHMNSDLHSFVPTQFAKSA